MKAGYYCHNDPDFEGVVFRRTSPPLKAAGGLFTEAKKLFRPFGTKIREKDMEIVFSGTGGGNLKFTHLEHENDAEGNHQGLQYSGIFFDELTHFEQSQFTYLIGRLRSASDTDSFVLATTNPSPTSWVISWVSWYLDEAGYPDPDKCGKIRYFLNIDDVPVFADTAEELEEEYPELCWQEDPSTGEMIHVPPMTFTFIGGTIFDNPALIRSNPKYLSALKAQSKVNRARLLDGNWFARPEGSNYVTRGMLKSASVVPLNAKRVRAWDKAGVEPSDVNRYPDFSAEIGMAKDSDGYFYIYGNFHEDCHDPKSEVCGRFRKRVGERDKLIKKQALLDGDEVKVILPKDAGAAGISEYENSAKDLTSEGITVKSDPMPTNKSKVTRFSPFASACENGLVYIVESSFPNKQTLNTYLTELENFDGERSTGTKKDDWADATATAFNFLAKEVVINTPCIPKISSPTNYSQRLG